MPDEPIEQSTEVPTLPPETVPTLPPVPEARDETAAPGSLESDVIEELIRPVPRPPSDPTVPPVPPTPPPRAEVTTSEPAPWLWWLTLGLSCAAIAIGVLYVVRARKGSHENRARDPGSAADRPGPATDGAP